MDRFKKTFLAFGISVMFLALGLNFAKADPRRSISLQTFYDELSYHGDWINNTEYGYVWRPNVDRDFRPYYTNGRWVMTEYGNTWVSDYEWGWAPFHYGRWFYDDYDGWVWLPDTEWGPAWVNWRSGGGYYGWAPLGPRININIGRNYYVPDNYWVFIPQRCIYYPSYTRYWEPRRNVVIIRNTTVINHIYTDRNTRSRYYTGPRVDEVRRATRQNVRVYQVNDASRPGSTRIDRNAVNVYRPTVRNNRADATPRVVANNSGSSRPSRSDAASNSGRTTRTDDGRSTTADNNTIRTERNNPSINNNRPSRVETDRSATPSQRTESSRPQREERPSASPQGDNRSERQPVPTQRSESTRPERPSSPSRTESSRPSTTPQRVERPTPSPSQQTRRETPSVERSQPQPQSSRSERSSEGESSRGSSDNSRRPR